MKTHLIAAEISRLVPELARDSAVNRETIIKNILDEAKQEMLRKIAGEILFDKPTTK